MSSIVTGLQSEIEEAYGIEGVPPKPADARKRKTLKLRKHYLLKPEFKALWDQIKHKTQYAVKVDTEKLIADVTPELDKATIRKPRVTIAKAELRAAKKEDLFEAIVQSGARTAIDLTGRYPLPNLVEIMESLMENTSPPMRVSRKTLLEVFKRSANRQAALGQSARIRDRRCLALSKPNSQTSSSTASSTRRSTSGTTRRCSRAKLRTFGRTTLSRAKQALALAARISTMGDPLIPRSRRPLPKTSKSERMLSSTSNYRTGSRSRHRSALTIPIGR